MDLALTRLGLAVLLAASLSACRGVEADADAVNGLRSATAALPTHTPSFAAARVGGGGADKPTIPPISPPQRPSASRTPPRGDMLRRPAWLGTRVLPRGPQGFGLVKPTPSVLRDRRLPTVDVLPPPRREVFRAQVSSLPPQVAARSTWSPACPVTLAELAYVRLPFWGFDGRAHTGELLVHTTAADDLVGVFRRLWTERFPIEEMRVVGRDELDAPPTGDGNNTTAFVCRAARGSGAWSQHAYGLAVDVNPFHNPYVRDGLVLPELASAYLNRDRERPGMIHSGDVVTTAFERIGWGWGGSWQEPRDWMHFSRTGR